MFETQCVRTRHPIRLDGQVKCVLEELNASSSRSLPSAIDCDAFPCELRDKQRIIVKNDGNPFSVKNGTPESSTTKEN